jgi:hypothetical protein
LDSGMAAFLTSSINPSYKNNALIHRQFNNSSGQNRWKY